MDAVRVQYLRLCLYLYLLRYEQTAQASCCFSSTAGSGPLFRGRQRADTPPFFPSSNWAIRPHCCDKTEAQEPWRHGDKTPGQVSVPKTPPRGALLVAVPVQTCSRWVPKTVLPTCHPR